MSVLYVVATPIGNLQDITLRALDVLRDVALIAAEDTRTTRKLLTNYDIKTRIASYNDHNMKSRIPMLLEALESADVALVSEAGMPTVSDPGHELIREAIKEGVEVVPIPGASALTTALAASGIPAQQCLFLGFLSRRKGNRRRLLESMKAQPWTLVVFEAPHRLIASLSDILEVLGDRQIAASRELTKIHEEIFRGTVSQAIAHFGEPRGEFTLVIAGAPPYQVEVDMDAIKAEIQKLRGRGIKAKEAVATITQSTGVPKKTVYKIWLDTQRSDPP